MSEYPPYSGIDTCCSKCGNSSASTHFFGYGQCSHPDEVFGLEGNERLHRECMSCDYQWDEAVIANGNSG